MFKINHIKENITNANYLELVNSSNSSYTKIFLNQGASLQELNLNNKTIIKNLDPSPYKNTFASSILFPFTNRVKDGKYKFQEKNYQLETNSINENNAIHGFVYNKTFEIKEQNSNKNEASVKLIYSESKKTKGFPFRYSIELIYTLTKDSLTLRVSVYNNDKKPFPFTMGWHPYFYSKSLYNSFLSLNTNKKISFDNRMILNGVNDIILEKDLQIKDNKLDDCYILNNNKMLFKTPDYTIRISSTSKENYLQIYTPNKTSAIAIEPCTSPSNGFNNKMGLQILEPDSSYNLTWKIELKD